VSIFRVRLHRTRSSRTRSPPTGWSNPRTRRRSRRRHRERRCWLPPGAGDGQPSWPVRLGL